MNLYYGLLTLSVVLFGVGFLCNDRYGKSCGGGLGATVLFSLLSNITGFAVMLVICRFHLSFTPFTVLFAALAACNNILYTLAALRALSRINLSLFTLFAMLGGMLLPFLAGLIFYGEPMTVGLGVCVALIAASLTLTIKPGGPRGGFWYYAGVFFFNGMSGVLSKLYTEAPYEKADAAVYSAWIALVTVAFCLVCLPFLRKRLPRLTPAAMLWSGGCGVVSRVANYWLVLALAVVPASLQYPFVTGGTIAVSTLLGYAVGQRPTRRELLAVLLAVIGVILLVLL